MQCVLDQITQGRAQITSPNGLSEAFALIIDGKSLSYALEDSMKALFLEVATHCASVICCRSSPKQKALVGFRTFGLYFCLIVPSKRILTLIHGGR